jgi:small subunit ribosomal protein S20
VPNLRSSFKRVKVAAKKAARNRPIRTATRTQYARAQEALAAGAEDSAEAVRRAISQLDRAVSKGVIHRNNAARRKSKLMLRLNALQANSASSQG